MASYERETTVDAPLERVWTFHSTIDGLRALTPGWLALDIEDIVHSYGDARDTETLTAGTEIHASVAPFWVLPRQHWVSVIESRTVSDDECEFVDTMRMGPLPGWRHTHRFIDDGDGTRVRDHVKFEAPGGLFGQYVITAGLAFFFAYRHWRTRKTLG